MRLDYPEIFTHAKFFKFILLLAVHTGEIGHSFSQIFIAILEYQSKYQEVGFDFDEILEFYFQNFF